MKLRLIESGFEAYTGDFGGVSFIDGVSSDNLSRREVDRLSAIVRVEAVDDAGAATGEAAGIAARLVSMNAATLDETQLPSQEEPPKLFVETVAAVYTREELETLADKGGITTLREIADPLEIKARSIAELIDGILAHQG